MRILLLVDSLVNGGAERQLALLATNLPADRERRVRALGGGPFEVFLRERGIAVDVCLRRHRFDPSPALDLWRDLWTRRPDVVHSWSWMSTLAAAPACRILGIPLIDGTIRTGGLQKHVLRLERLGMAGANVIVANNLAGLRAWGVRPGKGRVVYNGFDQTRLGEADASGADQSGPFTVIMVGRMEKEKDFAVVVEAVRLLGWAPGEARVLLVGDGSLRAPLMRRAGELMRSGVIVFPDPSIEIIELVRHADVGVLMTDPTHAVEGCSNAILEYMACGLPVVCGEGGGNREVVLDGVTGFVIPPADAAALAERLAYLRAHPDERGALGEAGRHRVATRFSVETMVGEFLAVYDDVLRERAGRSAARSRGALRPDGRRARS